MPGTTAAALCPVDVMNRAYGARTSPATLDAETIRKRHRHGQVFTPHHVAKEAAATLDLKANATGTIHILDAGAGDGQLTLATLDRIGREPEATRPRQIYLTAVEADTELADAYEQNLKRRRDLVQRAAHARAGRRGSGRLPVAPTLAVPVGERQRAHPDRRLHHEPAVPADSQRRP